MPQARVKRLCEVPSLAGSFFTSAVMLLLSLPFVSTLLSVCWHRPTFFTRT